MKCHIQNSVLRAIPLLTLCVLVALGSPAIALTRTWVTFGSGNFNDAANWFPSGIPGAGDFVSFEVGSGNPYKVTFPGNDIGIGGGGAGMPMPAMRPAFCGSATMELRLTDRVRLATALQRTRSQRDADRSQSGIIIGDGPAENASLTRQPFRHRLLWITFQFQRRGGHARRCRRCRGHAEHECGHVQCHRLRFYADPTDRRQQRHGHAECQQRRRCECHGLQQHRLAGTSLRRVSAP